MKLRTIFIFTLNSTQYRRPRPLAAPGGGQRRRQEVVPVRRRRGVGVAALARRLRSVGLAALTFACWSAAVPLPARAQPQIEMPPPEEPRALIPKPKALELPRESQIEVPLEQPAMTGTAIGGYGELTVNAPSNGPTVVDMRRLVLYFGHNFNEHIRFYGELEVEHAVTSATDKGEFEVEQAFLDYVQWKPFNLRAGVILMPVGIINVYHEPPSFNGVDRPLTDQVIIPTTWREPGAGFFGEWRGLRYQAYAVNGFNANGFTATNGLRDGHQEAQLALGRDWGIVARLEYGLPTLYRLGISSNVGVSTYYAHADQKQPQFQGVDGSDIPVSLLEADLRARFKGVELRGEIASVWIGGTHRLNRALAAAATPTQPFDGPVAHQLFGGYVELGYNVLHELKLKSGMQLTPFARYEHVDTQFDVPADLSRALGNQKDVVTAGLTFHPIAEVVVKFDYQHFWTDATLASAASYDSYNTGIGFMF
jgi:hypothetical protein